jgi:hypothetical protein
VKDDLFEVTLSFGGQSERLVVPYEAVTAFADPSMNFALKFRADYSHGDVEGVDGEKDEQEPKEEIDLSAKVISLDAFKKNQNDD